MFLNICVVVVVNDSVLFWAWRNCIIFTKAKVTAAHHSVLKQNYMTCLLRRARRGWIVVIMIPPRWSSYAIADGVVIANYKAAVVMQTKLNPLASLLGSGGHPVVSPCRVSSDAPSSPLSCCLARQVDATTRTATKIVMTTQYNYIINKPFYG